jgi:hypothetical protein
MAVTSIAAGGMTISRLAVAVSSVSITAGGGVTAEGDDDHEGGELDGGLHGGLLTFGFTLVLLTRYLSPASAVARPPEVSVFFADARLP